MTVTVFINVAIGMLETFAQHTGTLADDRTIQVLNIIKNDADLMAWLEPWIPTRAAGTIGGGGTLTMQQGMIPAQIKAKFSEADLQSILSVVAMLVEMWKVFRTNQLVS